MISLDVHAHLLNLLGCSRDPKVPLIITELCEKGDLLNLLRKAEKEEAFLAGKSIIHRDMAARNVLITDRNVAKLADFGLCRRSSSLQYTGKGGRLPVKWMAPESLKTAEFSEKTDVWSYGVFLWEMFTFGKAPFVSVDPVDMWAHLKEGNRLEFPEETPEIICGVAAECFEFEPESRPTFQSISLVLYKMLEEDASHYGYVDLQAQIEESKKIEELDSEENKEKES